MSFVSFSHSIVNFASLIQAYYYYYYYYTTTQTRNRKRNIIWYNPPFSKNVSTNIGQTFLNIIDDEFPAGHPLHKIFNRNTVKISYSCMPNIKQIIDGHNKTKLSQTATTREKAHVTVEREECPSPKNVWSSSLCIKLQFLPTTTVHLKHTLVLLKTLLKLDNHKTSFNSYEKRIEVRNFQFFNPSWPCTSVHGRASNW